MTWQDIASRLRDANFADIDLVPRFIALMRDEIYGGNLRGGTRLPGEKEFAATLRIGRSTLREALRVLVNEGLLVSRWGVGTFVTERLPEVGRALSPSARLWLEEDWTLLSDTQPSQGATLRRRVYGKGTQVCAVIDDIAEGSERVAESGTTIVAVGSASLVADLFPPDEPLLAITEIVEAGDPPRPLLRKIYRSTRSAPLRL